MKTTQPMQNHLLAKLLAERGELDYLISLLQAQTEKTPSLFDASIKEEVKQELRELEGLRLERYIDTLGYYTIGYGHLLKPDEDYQNITLDFAEKLLDSDYFKALKIAKQIIPNYETHPHNVRKFLVHQAFNMGENLNKFKTSLPLIINGDYEQARLNFKKSLWCKQVKSYRCTKITNLLKGK